MTKVAVMGAGSWGTAFSVVLADAGNDVTLWARREDLCATINEKRENTDYLPGIDLPGAVRATHDADEALGGADGVYFVVPAQTFRQNLRDWLDLIPQEALLVSMMKGVELGSLKRMSEDFPTGYDEAALKAFVDLATRWAVAGRDCRERRAETGAHGPHPHPSR